MKLLFYTGSFTHPFYKEQFSAFPEFVEVVPSSRDLRENKKIRKDYVSGIRPFLKKLFFSSALTAVKFFKQPKSAKVDLKGCDMVYSGQTIIRNKIPYVCDFEHAAAFAYYDQKLFENKNFSEKIIKYFRDRNCKYLLPWTKAAKKSLINSVDCSGFEEKIRVIYPAIRAKTKGQIKHEGINLLFVGGSFVFKGGITLLKAYDDVLKKINEKVTLFVVSNDVPLEIKKKYESRVNFLSNISGDELAKLYQQADIFIFPSYLDTFGFVVLEAMSYGLPCIVVDSFALPELVTNEKTGLVVNSYISLYDKKLRYRHDLLKKKENFLFYEECLNPSKKEVALLSGAMKKLIVNKTLRKFLGRAALKEVESGRFSVAKRKKAISEIL